MIAIAYSNALMDLSDIHQRQNTASSEISGQRYYPDQTPRDNSQQRPIYQPQLPSFNEILPRRDHPTIDSATRPPGQRIPPPSDPDVSPTSSINVVPVSNRLSPHFSPSTSMPDGFDDYSRVQDPEYSAHAQHQRPNLSWSSNPQYPTMISPYGASQRAPYQNPPLPRPSPNLPPIRDLDPRLERTNGQDATYSVAPNQYPQVYTHLPPNNAISDNQSYSTRRPSYYENTPRYNQPSLPPTRPYPAVQPEYPRYGQPPIDPYRNQQNFHGPFGSLEYGTQASGNVQSPAYGPGTESSDGRNRRRRGNLPKQVTDILRTWFHEHLDHPYPSEEDKQYFIQRTGLTMNQISNWFINARRRQLPALRHARDRGNQIPPGEQEADLDFRHN